MCPDLPSPEEWGWSLSETGFSPYWTALPEASLAIRYLIKCLCGPDLGCVGRCKCVKVEFLCTDVNMMEIVNGSKQSISL